LGVHVDKVQLASEWVVGDPIGGGGFGKVYEASSADHPRAAIKLVPKVPGAQRELLLADVSNARNVVPIIDSGESGDNWAIVMPRAERSLRDYLAGTSGPLGVKEAVAVLADVAAALSDLEGRVVHRDLKPENVLLLAGHWCLADFGISRYAEATTAPDTRKYSLTPEYAAPERWRAERATTSTDVYSLGILAHELLAGQRPFQGPQPEDFREQHLHVDAPHLEGVPTALATLVDECLYKPAGARPSPANMLARLSRISDDPKSPGLAKLQQANRVEVNRQGVAGRRESEKQSENERVVELATVAKHALKQMADALRDAIEQAAPMTSFSVGLPIGWTAALGQAHLRIEPPSVTANSPWSGAMVPAFEVISHSALSVTFPRNRSGYVGRSHSLWFCDAQETGRYQWFETAFMISPLIPRMSEEDPFALNPGGDAAQAVGRVTGSHQVAWPFSAVSIGEIDDFIGRWAGWFADAAQGHLNRPGTMPERQPQGSWRQH
jgi:serine/threonine-protein kinase